VQLHKILSILVVMIMGFSFNPIQDNDWQGLNIMLEKLFYSEAQAANKVKTKKTGSVSARKTVTIKNDASSEIADGNNIDVKIQGVDDGQGVSLYVDGGSDENVTIPDTGIIYKTQAKIAVPSSYFLDLRGIYKTTATQQYTADVAILHDVNGNTITLTSLDETNDVSIAGPIAGGRDQAGAFDAPSWIHFFFIYNPITGDVSSLSSASPTAPTLPTGYTFFVRCGAVYFKDTSVLTQSAQLGDTVYVNAVGLWNGAPSVANTYQTLDLSGAIPPTAKKIVGRFGFSSTTPSTDQAMFLSADSTTAVCYTWGNLSKDALYKDNLGDAQFFTMPILTSQTIWWTADSTDAWYGITIREFQDDL